MSPEKRLAFAKFIYQAKDWTVIICTVFGLFMWGTKFADLPKRVDKIEMKQQEMIEKMYDVSAGVKYLVREQKKVDL